MAEVTPEVEFDLSKVTAEEMDDFFVGVRENNQKKIAQIFPSVVKRCPSTWGDKTKAETFLRLPYFGAWKTLVSAFVDEASGKN